MPPVVAGHHSHLSAPKRAAYGLDLLANDNGDKTPTCTYQSSDHHLPHDSSAGVINTNRKRVRQADSPSSTEHTLRAGTAPRDRPAGSSDAPSEDIRLTPTPLGTRLDTARSPQLKANLLFAPLSPLEFNFGNGDLSLSPVLPGQLEMQHGCEGQSTPSRLSGFDLARDSSKENWTDGGQQYTEFSDSIFPDPLGDISNVSTTSPDFSTPAFDISLFPEEASSFNFDLSSPLSHQPIVTLDTIVPNTWTSRPRPYWLAPDSGFRYDSYQNASGFDFNLSPVPATQDSATVQLSLSDRVTIDINSHGDNDFTFGLVPPTEPVSPNNHAAPFGYLPTNLINANSTGYGSDAVEIDEVLSSGWALSSPQRSFNQASMAEELQRLSPRSGISVASRSPAHSELPRHGRFFGSYDYGRASASNEEVLLQATLGSSDLYLPSESDSPAEQISHFDPVLYPSPGSNFPSPDFDSASRAATRPHHRKRSVGKSTTASNSRQTGKSNHRSGLPILTVTEDSNDTQPEVQELLAKKNQIYQSGRAAASAQDTSKNEAPQVRWEHHFAYPETFQKLEPQAPKDVNRTKIGRRTGPLPSQVRKKAANIRRRGACWNCSINKQDCSSHDICLRCRTATPSPLTGRFCTRVRFIDYTDLFFPAPALGMFQKSVIKKLLEDKVEYFTENEMQIYLGIGPTYPPIRVLVKEYKPADIEFLAIPQLATDHTTQQSVFTTCYTPPLAVCDPDDTVRARCLEHIRQVSRGERNYGEVSYGQTAALAWDVFEVITKYQRTSRNPLIRKALMLYAMFYFLLHTINFTEASAEEIIRSLTQPTQFRYKRDRTARLVNRQIKQVMYVLTHETMADVLEGLERELRSREKSAWAPAFCVILVLCMCVEIVQVAVDVKVVQRIVKGTPGVSRGSTIDLCRKMDDIPMAQCISIFHARHRTKKPRVGPRNEHGFNPLRDGLEVDKTTGITQEMVDLVEEMQGAIHTHRNDLPIRAREPALDNLPDLMANHMRFQRENTGRLVAKFLLFFL